MILITLSYLAVIESKKLSAWKKKNKKTAALLNLFLSRIQKKNIHPTSVLLVNNTIVIAHDKLEEREIKIIEKDSMKLQTIVVLRNEIKKQKEYIVIKNPENYWSIIAQK